MKRILIADDSPQGRELLRAVLQHSGYEVLEAANGAEAVALARTHRPELIILDIRMPVVDGYGAVKELRMDEAFRRTPILALTASAMEGDREHALQSGFTEFLVKPISISALRDQIRRYLG